MAHRILLADDSPTTRQAVKSLLEYEGYEVIAEAVDGTEAVRLTRSLAPDVVVLDLAMPLLDGIDAAREIHRTSPGTPLVLLTIHTGEENIVSAMLAGVLACVAKCDAAEDLPRAIREAVCGRTFLSLQPSRVVLEVLMAEYRRYL